MKVDISEYNRCSPKSYTYAVTYSVFKGSSNYVAIFRIKTKTRNIKSYLTSRYHKDFRNNKKKKQKGRSHKRS